MSAAALSLDDLVPEEARQPSREPGSCTPDRLTPEFYAQLIDEFRKHPGQTKVVADIVKCSVGTSVKAWHRGWKKVSWAPAIKTLFSTETRDARARAGGRVDTWTEREDRRERERQFAIDMRAAEAELIGKARENVASLVKTTGTLLGAGESLAKVVVESITGGAVDPDTAMAWLRQIAAVGKTGLEAGKLVMEMTRLHLGMPQQILGISGDVEDMSLEDTAKEIREANEALARVRKKGLVDLGIDGDPDEDQPDDEAEEIEAQAEESETP